MKGKIDKYGQLWVVRAGKITAQLCPFIPDVERLNCRDWCSHFEEPEEVLGMWVVRLCHGKEWSFHEFEDERGKK